MACRALENIWVLDVDRDVDESKGWPAILDAVEKAKYTLVLRSCTKGRPHYVFAQDESADGEWVAEGVWEGGEVKATGMIVISKEPPIVDAPVALAPKGLLDRLKKGRPRGASGRGLASSEDLWEWLESTPDAQDMILSEGGGERLPS